MQQVADARLNAVYGSWTNALKHPAPDDAKDDAEVLGLSPPSGRGSLPGQGL